MTRTPSTSRLPTAGLLDTLLTAGLVLLPVVGRGAIVRRPRIVGLAQRLDADALAVRQLQRLRARYGPGPLQLRLPGRRLTLLLEPQQVHRVLNGSPTPFAVATREKRAALAHFQPAGLLASAPAQRQHRRTFNEAVLDAGQPLHRLAGPVAAAVRQEAELLLEQADRTGALTWEGFSTGWWRAARRVTLGDSAREDQQTTNQLLRLRRRANWSFTSPQHTALRRRFLARVRAHVEQAEPGSLASLVNSTPAHPDTDPVQQVPQWLFAFDATAAATFRALALLSAHPDAADRARTESSSGSPDLPFLRACVLESLRLWPTTPAILRDTTEQTHWQAGVLPTGASVVLYAPFFHRDDTRVPEAHRFAPELWLRERTDDDWPLVPFSGGPAMCPGRNVVLLTASVMLAALTERHRFTIRGAPLDPARPLPGTLSPFRLRFEPLPRH